MIYVENIETFGFEGAMRGMRNPHNSWAKNDTHGNDIGVNDLMLANKLILAGSDHRKFLRMMHIQMDITAPLFWWKEFDTYKVGTVANSCSTMHRIERKPITIDDFSYSDLAFCDFKGIVANCEKLRCKYNETHDKKYWRQLIEVLPNSYNQKRTVDMNYETAMRIYFARRGHKLDEWRELCACFTANLPYFESFVHNVEEAASEIRKGK